MARKNRRQSPRDLDPHRAREARKYENPIPSREYILGVLKSYGAPLSFSEVSEQLDLSSAQDLEALRRRLNAMERDGQLVVNRRGGYCLVNHKDLIAGRVIGHPDGFGFLKPDEGSDDLYLSPRQMRGVLHDDRAVVRVVGVDRRGRREAAVVEVLERSTRRVVGRLFQEGGVGFVLPDNKRLHQEIVIPSAELGEAKAGQMVVAEITEQPTARTQPVGRVVEVLGEHMAPGMETDIAIRSHGLPVDWPEEVEREIKDLDREVPEASKRGRVDLRALSLVTIDGADARDFDDAVYCESTPKGWRLLVSIADVSSYVAPDTALDEEAYNRGNSAYFPDRVIPMLPEVLSNGLCSLNPQVDRLCMTCEMYVDRSGKVTRSRFFEAVMRSHARLTYDEVAGLLVDRDPGLQSRYQSLLPHLGKLYELYKVLQAARFERGAVDFDTTESRFVFNAQKKVEQIIPVVRNDAHRLIEECMLLANVSAAKLLQRKRLQALYRIHEGPPEEKLNDLREFLGELGLHLPGGKKPTAKDYAALLDAIQNRPDAHLIQTVLLRSLSQAVYSSQNAGHFGLSYPAYTHFTSPIRRYPDLVVHRALKHLIAGGGAEDFEYSQSRLQGMGEHCSTTERRADEATRDAIDWLKCEYMLDRVGEELSGIISGVSSFGLFVELDEIFISGLVHITALDNDFYHFDPIGHRLTGERSGMLYRLGDPIRVRVAAVNLDERKIDLVLAEPPSRRGGPRSGLYRSRRRSSPEPGERGHTQEDGPAVRSGGRRVTTRGRRGDAVPEGKTSGSVSGKRRKPAVRKTGRK